MRETITIVTFKSEEALRKLGRIDKVCNLLANRKFEVSEIWDIDVVYLKSQKGPKSDLVRGSWHFDNFVECEALYKLKDRICEHTLQR